MYTAVITDTRLVQDHIDVLVHYEDENGNKFDQTLTTDKFQDDKWPQEQIQTKLNQLNSLSTIQTKIKVNIPISTVFSVDRDTAILKMNQSTNDGVIKEDISQVDIIGG